ncbi:MAG: hypothetical protein WC139_07035 [Candidatus Kapaibacterium sp.]
MDIAETVFRNVPKITGGREDAVFKSKTLPAGVAGEVIYYDQYAAQRVSGLDFESCSPYVITTESNVTGHDRQTLTITVRSKIYRAGEFKPGGTGLIIIDLTDV